MGHVTTGQHYPWERRPHPPQIIRSTRDHPKPSVAPAAAADDKMIYQNMVEMMPFSNPFLDQPSPKSCTTRHASLVYTPTPARDIWPFKKEIQNANMPKMSPRQMSPRQMSPRQEIQSANITKMSPRQQLSPRQLTPGRRAKPKNSLLWGNDRPTLHDDHQNVYSEDIPMLPYPSSHRGRRSPVSNIDMMQLQNRVEQLEQNLYEKEHQLRSAEQSNQQLQSQLNTEFERLQIQLQQKEQAIQSIENELYKKQLEVVSLQSLMKKAEVNTHAANMRVVSLEEELNSLRNHLGSALDFLENQPDYEGEKFIIPDCKMPSTSIEMNINAISMSQDHIFEEDELELARRKYLAVVIATREKPTEEMLLLVSELREYLKGLVIPTEDSDMANDMQRPQSLNEIQVY